MDYTIDVPKKEITLAEPIELVVLLDIALAVFGEDLSGITVKVGMPSPWVPLGVNSTL